MKAKKQVIFLLLCIIALLANGCGNSKTESDTNKVGNINAVTGGVVEIPVSEVISEAKFYSFDYDGVKINYFAVKGSDGEIRTAFDACDVCGGRKGYRQQGDDMVCNNCGRYFNIDEIGTKNKGGGCWPSYLSHEIKGDNIIIKEQDLMKGRRFF